MAWSDDAFNAKLSSLNETQDSIVTASQWILFHRRHATRAAQLWQSRLLASPAQKRLNLLYLANDVVQQNRARNRTDFLLAFEPIIGEATAAAYKSASQEVQGKIRRVVEVWRARKIFDPAILEALEGRLAEADQERVKAGGGRGKLGGSLFGGSSGAGGGSSGVPAELEEASKRFAAAAKATAAGREKLEKADEEFGKMMSPDTPVPTAPLHAAKLSGLMHSLALAQGAIDASISARKEALAELERLMSTHRDKLAEEETQAAEIAGRRETIENKKREVEDIIMRGLSTPASPDNVDGAAASRPDVSAPEAEGFTPPPPDVEAFTPPAEADAKAEAEPRSQTENVTMDILPSERSRDDNYTFHGDDGHMNANGEGSLLQIAYHPDHQHQQLSSPINPSNGTDSVNSASAAAAAANDFLNNLQLNTQARNTRQASTDLSAGNINTNGSANGISSQGTSDPRLKRRKLSHGPRNEETLEDMAGMLGDGGFGETGVDEEGVSRLLDA